MKNVLLTLCGLLLLANTALAAPRAVLQDGSGNEVGTAANPLKVSLSGGGGSGTPGGSDTHVQYNDAGALGGDAGLTYNETTNALTVDGTATVDGLAVTGGSEKILTSSGSVTIGGTGNTNNEKILFDFETNANKLTLSTATGVTVIDYAGIGADYDAASVTLSTLLGAVDAGGSTSFEVPNGAAPTTNAAGEIALDTTITDHQPLLQYYDGGENMTVIAIDTAELPATDNEIIKYDAATDKFVLEADAGGGGGSATQSIIINPGSMMISGTLALTGDATVGATVDSSNGSVLLFTETTDSGAGWRGKLPSNWSAHGTIKLNYSMTSATSGTVEFEAAIMCTSPGDSARDDADSFAAFAVAADTVPGTVRFVDTVSITPTDDSCAAGDDIMINISTDSDDATNDTATGTRRLIGVVYEYTAS